MEVNMKLKDIDVYGGLLKKYNKATAEQQGYIRSQTANAIKNFEKVYEEMLKSMK